MKHIDINRLLNEFYEGKTNLEQEKELLKFFKSDEVPEDLLEEQAIFLSCFKGEENNVPTDLQTSLETLIDNLARKESPVISQSQENIVQRTLNPKTAPPKFKIIKIDSMSLRFSAIAASIILIFTISLFAYRYNDSNKLADTYTNPNDAYLETKRALTLVAQNLNTGFSQLEEAQADIGKANQIMNKQLKKISKR